MKKIGIIIMALALACCARATEFTENFTGNPLTNGWQIFGDTNLFRWDSTNHDLAVTTDSSQTNSYFYKPLGVSLTANSNFAFSFDLTVNDFITVGGTFQIAIGLLNFTNATNVNVLRGTGVNTTNLVEFDFFADPDFGNSFSATEYDTNGLFGDVYDFVTWTTNTTYHVSVTHFAGEQLVSAQVAIDGQVYSLLPGTFVLNKFGDFNVDTLAVMSYDATGAYNNNGTQGGVSLLAHGTVGNYSFTTSPNPVGGFTGQLAGQTWQGQFQSYPEWNYFLERSSDLRNWAPASSTNTGTGTVLMLSDTNAPSGNAFYRVHAQR